MEIPVDWTLGGWEQHGLYPGWTGSGVIESPAKVHEMWRSRPTRSTSKAAAAS